MSQSRVRGDLFSSFVDKKTGPRHTRSAPGKGEEETMRRALGMLRMLVDRGGAMPMKDLLDQVGPPLVEAARAVENLSGDELVRIEKQDGDEIVSVTELGLRVAKYS